jgi:hypothetical protein
MKRSLGPWKLHKFFFCQANALRRLARVRIAVGACVAITVAYGAFDTFFADNAYLYSAEGHPHWWLPQLAAAEYNQLRVTAIVTATTLAVGFHARASAAVAALCFFFINGYTAHFVRGVFNYDTHLNFFLTGLCFVDSGRYYSIDARRRRGTQSDAHSASERDAFVLAAMQVLVALVYWQAFLAKLVLGGAIWFTEGRVIMFETAWFDTPIGRRMLAFPAVFPVIGVMTGAFEFLAGFGFLKGGAAARWTVAAAIAFHFGVWLTLGISFFHLVAVLPWLFFDIAPAIPPASEQITAV